MFDSSTPGFNLVQGKVLLKVATPLEYVRRCYVQYIYIKEEKIDSFSLFRFIQCNFVTFWFC